MSALRQRALRLALAANAIREIQAEAVDPARGRIRILPGDVAATGRVQEILGTAGSDMLPPEGGVLIHVAVPGEDPTAPVAQMSARVRGGGPAIVLLTGEPDERRDLEAAYIAEGLTVLHVVHIPTLEGAAGERMVCDAVARALGPEQVAAARRLPALRPAVNRRLVEDTARQVGVLGAANMLPGGVYMQVNLVQRMAAASGRPMGRERIPEVVGVIAAGWAWRLVARQAGRALGGPDWLARAGVAYGTTRVVGDVAGRWMARGGAAADQPLTALRAAVQARLGRGGNGDGAHADRSRPDPAKALSGLLARVRGRGDGV